MARRNRPTAFDVSFPEEVEAMAAEEAEEATVPKSIHPYATESRNPFVASSSLKRKNDGPVDTRAIKRLQLPPVEYYHKRREELPETSELVIKGEDPEVGLDEGEKPIRLLSDFSIFDPKHRNEFVSLAAIEEDDGVDRQFEGAGMVMPHFVSEEDEGQDEEAEIEPQYVRLSAILRYTIDYARESEPFYIETEYAWYILRRPSQRYLPHYRHFYTPRRIAQLVISSALKCPTQTWDGFVTAFTSKVDMFGKTYLKEHISESISEIQEAVLNEPECKRIATVPFVRHLFSTGPALDSRRRKSTINGPRNRHLPKNKALTGNPDLAVLKAENQNPTHVTPRIAALAHGLIREKLVVVGPPPLPPNKDLNHLVQIERKRAYDHLCRLVAKAKKRIKNIDYQKEDRVSLYSEFYKAVEVEKEIYRIGDVVLIPNDTKARWEDPEIQRSQIRIPPDARVDDFFWFGKIQYVYMEVQRAHVQWLNHGSYTVMSELALDQELFLSDECGEIDVSKIIGKVTVHERPSIETIIKPHEYFCKFMYDPVLSTFTSMDVKRLALAAAQEPPHNCPACLLNVQRNQEKETRELKDEHGNKHGVSFAGVDYHLEDFVLYRAETGPANIGYVIKIQVAKESITIRKVGRISSLEDGILPDHILRDERHLYLTDEKVIIPISDLIKVIYVPCLQSFKPPYATLDDWKALSYDHFYLRYNFPKFKVESWRDRKTVAWQDLLVCTPCCKERLKGRKSLYKFLEQSERQPLPTLDLFGGVGAFSRGLAEGSGCLKVTHAIEISPSAAKTFMRNSPDTIVYNQCANIMLRYAIKSQEGHQLEVPKQLFDDKIPVPDAPQRGVIKVITAGFPCQTHSTLNMFKDADDIKSNLILTTLSFLDHYRPALAFFENVPGFLNYSLNATQVDRYRVEGGLDMGGLKLLVRALIDMGYQVRYGLLQAGHYGTPQRRIRFFLIAAAGDQILPELPQPTHEFPEVNSLQIKHPKQDNRTSHTIRPIRTTQGTAAHPSVTIEAAIGDLPRFDWKNPKPERDSAAKRLERKKREREIPSLECKISDPYCGFRGQIGYHHEPKTTYQQKARLVPTQDLQQYTKCLLAHKVERVLHIPLTAGGDYRSLPPGQLEWQFADPSSSIARAKYRPGAYGRLDKDAFFPTTVTNVDPTAKQCRVLHPSCHRMVTVRELARSQGFPDDFVFEAIGQNVVTMHRQIGNAVPLPVAHALGRELRKVLYQKWKANLEEAIWIDDNTEDEPDEHRLEIVDGRNEPDDDDSDRMDTD